MAMKKKAKKTDKATRLKIGTITFLTLSAGIILFPIKPAVTTVQVAFVRNTEQLGNTHGAAGQRDYLFEDETQTYSGTLWANTQTTLQITTGGSLQTTSATPQDTSGDMFSSMQTSFYQALLGNQTSGTLTTTWIEKDMLPDTIIVKNCMTPRWEEIADKDFVLAYEQRDDVPTICNTERRICNSGALEWSYTQPSCKENVTYEYTKAQVISYNEPVVNPLVQPGEPSNIGADFSTNGKINEVKQPTSMRWPASTGQTTTTTAVKQIIVKKYNCTSPRGTQVKHGQFVKAYKSSIGLLDVPCETELRLCVNGTLKGNFLNKSCTFKDMTYNDYLVGNRDLTKPTPQDLQDTLTDQNTTSDPTKTYGPRDWVRAIFQ